MLNVERLKADAQDAQIRSEMARSQLLAAKTNLRRLGIRWSETKGRISITQSGIAPINSPTLDATERVQHRHRNG
jgi:hypothetical protein